MTCRCGAKMCYLCKKEVKDYSHFYGQGGAPTDTRTCPLYSDIEKVHKMELAKAAKEAKQELKEANITLSVDPTKDVVMMEDLEDVVRDRLFKRWFEVFSRVDSMKNMPCGLKKANCQAILERVRVMIGGNDVTKLENMIKMELEALWIKAATS